MGIYNSAQSHAPLGSLNREGAGATLGNSGIVVRQGADCRYDLSVHSAPTNGTLAKIP